MHRADLTPGLQHAIRSFAREGCEVFLRSITPSTFGDEMLLQIGAVRRRVAVRHSWHDGTWPFTIPFFTSKDREQCLINWIQSERHIDFLCLLGYGTLPQGEPPRLYLASQAEAMNHLLTSRPGTILTKLEEFREEPDGTVIPLPASWKFSRHRLFATLFPGG